MGSALNSREVFKDWLANATPGEINNWADIGLRHKSGVKPEDRLSRFINIARHFGYATRDDSWGEFEKMFCIIITRLVVAERDLQAMRAHPTIAAPPLCDRCTFCGAEDPTPADVFLCREKPCVLRTPAPNTEGALDEQH